MNNLRDKYLQREKNKSFILGLVLGAITLFVGELLYELMFDPTVWLN
jgi:hypothetical protein